MYAGNTVWHIYWLENETVDPRRWLIVSKVGDYTSTLASRL